jgi:DNA/RNA-binding domain of Phe-tRNA-synthetase-like protein
LQAYRNYYQKFGNSYHVQLQLESVAHKHKSLPQVSPLVDANFAAELDTFILTAGHDANTLEPPLIIDVTQAGETFTQLTGKTRTLKGGDMVMRDARGAVCTILYGQDQRTAISRQTRDALYVAYAPLGIPEQAVAKQLETISQLVLSFDENAQVALLAVHG